MPSQSFTISDEQQAQLLGDGYTLLPTALPDALLSRWQTLAERLEHEALAAYHNGDQMHGACVIEDPVGPRVMRVDDVLGTDPDAVLELLACPAMLAVARDLCGRGAIPLQLDILYKHQHPHPVILWHQGAPHPRGFPYLNIGIYLDDANEGDGCLKYVPNTQHDMQDIAGLSRQHGWDIPGVIEQPAQAGDILIQDMMILHGSAPKHSDGVRRTIYVEIRPMDGVRESESQSEQWIELRRRWMGLVLAHADTGNWPDQWRDDYPQGEENAQALADQVIQEREPPIPAVYSIESIETAGYPVPESLKSPEHENTDPQATA